MRKLNRFACVITAVIITAFLLSGCDDLNKYGGKNPELFTELANSLPGLDHALETEIILLETDDYGRVLFACSALSCVPDRYQEHDVLALAVAQGTQEDAVFYLEDVNITIKEIPSDRELTLELVQEKFDQAEIDLLKDANHWNQPLSDNLVRKNTIRRVEDPIPDDVREQVFLNHVSKLYHPGCDTYLTSDNQGRSIYFAREWWAAEGDTKLGRGYFVMYDPSGAFLDIQEVQDIWNYQQELKEFKERNGWNME